MKIKDLCESERPREKMVSRGPQSLGNAELLAILLRSGNKNCSAIELANQMLLDHGGELRSLFGSSYASLVETPGIGADKAASILAAAELGRRFLQESSATTLPITDASMVYHMMLPLLKGLDHEECWILLLNANNVVIGQEKMSFGGTQSTTVDPGGIARLCLENKASGCILVHNHPSGNPNPSGADVHQTEIVRAALNACEIVLLDHIVVCDSCYFSFADGQLSKV